MTLIWIDGFDNYANGPEFLDKWDYANSQSHGLSGGRTNGYLRLGNDFSGPRKSFPSLGHITMVIGFAMDKRNNGGTQSVAFYSGQFAQPQCVFIFDTKVWAQLYGSGSVPAPGATTVFATSPPSTVPVMGYDYYELLVTLDAAAGVMRCRKNGIEILTATGINNKPNSGTTIDSFQLQTYNGSPDFDDLYVCNGAGVRNNTFLGDCRVRQLTPVGTGTTTQFTPSTGSNFQNVDEIPVNTADYNSGTVDGNRDTYAMLDLTESPTSLVYGIMETIVAAKSDAGTKFVAPVVRSGPTDYVRASQALSTTYRRYTQLEEVNPNGGAVWSVATANAAEFGAAAKDT